MKKEESSFIQSVDRALTLLEHIAEHPERRAGLGDLAEVIEVDRSSVFRLLMTLMRHGLVRQDGSRKSYHLGFGVLRLAGLLREQLKITEVASPFLKEIARNSRENAHLAVRSERRAVFIDRERGATLISTHTNIGDTEVLYCTAVGKCLISDLSRQELEELLAAEPLTRYTARTIIDPGAIAAELLRVRKQGFAVDIEEFESNVACVAAPIYNFEAQLEASIGISGPMDRIAPRLGELTAAVRDAGRKISHLLGQAGGDVV